MKLKIRIKRAYEPAEKSDGTRILVDRVWPRGVSKEEARIDLWLKEIAPSTELRKAFGHEVKKWRVFRTQYRRELARHGEQLERIRDRARAGAVTLVYGARDEEHNQAMVLKQVLENR